MTQIRKIRTLALATVLTFIAAAVVVPTATAQSPSSLILGTPSVTYSNGDTNALVPDTGRAEVKFTWDWRAETTGFEAVGLQQASGTLSVTSKDCEGRSSIKITGASSYPIVLREGATAPEASDSGSATFILSATDQAPGEQAITCIFKMKSEQVGTAAQTSIAASSEQSAETTITVRYFGLITASIERTIDTAGPYKEIPYQITITNLGNSKSNIRFSLENADTASRGGWNPVPPLTFTLESAAQGGTATSQQTSFLVSTPHKNGWNNDQKSFTLNIVPESTKDPEKKGSALSVQVLSRVRGVYVPSLEPLVMVGAVIGSALVVRLMRENDDE